MGVSRASNRYAQTTTCRFGLDEAQIVVLRAHQAVLVEDVMLS